MSRGVSKYPKKVQELGEHVLGYLSNTVGTCLVYRPCSRDHGFTGTLQVPRHERLLEAFADISFAPQGDKSHQGIIVCMGGSPIQWEVSKQAFHTMSTAESELVGYCEAATMLKSTEALLTVIHDTPTVNEPFEKVIYGDNSSALSILTNPDGGWRTRHLRLRSSGLRELLREEPQTWKIRHQRGVDLPADMLTKPIVLVKEWLKFWQFLGFGLDTEDCPGSKKKPSEDSLVIPSPLSGGDDDLGDTKAEVDETKESMSRIAAVVGLAACAIGAGMATSARTRGGCALAAAACAGWLAGEATATSRQRSTVKSENKKDQSKAIGNKKGQEVRENEPTLQQKTIVREDEPAIGEEKTIVREDEPAIGEEKTVVREDEPAIGEEKTIVREDEPTVEKREEKATRFTTTCIEEKEKKKEGLGTGLSSGNPQNVGDNPQGCGEDGPRFGSRAFQSRGRVPFGGKDGNIVEKAQQGVMENAPISRQCEAVSQHHCPEAAPSKRRHRGLRQCPCAMERQAMVEELEAKLLKDQLRSRCLDLMDLGLWHNTRKSLRKNPKTNGVLSSTMASSIGWKPISVPESGCSIHYTGVSRWRFSNYRTTGLPWCFLWKEKVLQRNRLTSGWISTELLAKHGWDTPFLRWRRSIRPRAMSRLLHGFRRALLRRVGVERKPIKGKVTAERGPLWMDLWWRSTWTSLWRALWDLKMLGVGRAIQMMVSGLRLPVPMMVLRMAGLWFLRWMSSSLGKSPSKGKDEPQKSAGGSVIHEPPRLPVE